LFQIKDLLEYHKTTHAGTTYGVNESAMEGIRARGREEDGRVPLEDGQLGKNYSRPTSKKHKKK
jgi:hypothetical protein